MKILEDVLTTLRKHEVSDEKIKLCVKLLDDNDNITLKNFCNRMKQLVFTDYDFVHCVLIDVSELYNDLRYDLQKRSKECFCF